MNAAPPLPEAEWNVEWSDFDRLLLRVPDEMQVDSLPPELG